MRTLTQLAGEPVCAQIQALAATVIEGPIERAESAAEEAFNLLNFLTKSTPREDERMMLQLTATAFYGASRLCSHAIDRRRLMRRVAVAQGYIRPLGGSRS